MTRHKRREERAVSETPSERKSGSPLPPGVNAGGSGPLLGDRTARLFFTLWRKKQEERKNRKSKTLAFQNKESEYANDYQPVQKPRPRMAMATAALLACAAVGINSSTIATQAVLHASDGVLLTAMEISPEALAHVLNAVDVGE